MCENPVLDYSIEDQGFQIVNEALDDIGIVKNKAEWVYYARREFNGLSAVDLIKAGRTDVILHYIANNCKDKV